MYSHLWCHCCWDMGIQYPRRESVEKLTFMYLLIPRILQDKILFCQTDTVFVPVKEQVG